MAERTRSSLGDQLVVVAGFFVFGVLYGTTYSFPPLAPRLLLATAAVSPAAGRLLDRFGPRVALVAGTTLLGSAWLAVSRATAEWQLYVAAVLLLAPAFGLLQVGALVGLSRSEKRGRALGVGTALAEHPAVAGAAVELIDRKALPDPPPEESAGNGRPETPWEEVVADVLARRLDAGTVGRDDRFFELGGRSLAALGVIGELKAQCGVQLPVSMLLGNASIAEIGVALEAEVVRALGPGQLDALLDQVAAGGGST